MPRVDCPPDRPSRAVAGLRASDERTLLPRVKLETSLGNIVVEVDTVRAPLTAENFLRYVRDGAYDGTVFHRVIANFVIQGGGYDERLAEQPARAPIPNESGNGLSNTPRNARACARGLAAFRHVAVLHQPR